MNNEKKQRLEEAIAAIQREYGQDTIRPLADSSAGSVVPPLSTGFMILDEALRGGILRGSLTELHGVGASGLATVAFRVLANAQEAGDTAVYIDLSRSFHRNYAVHCGVNVSTLTMARPDNKHQEENTRQGLSFIHDVITLACAGIVVLDFGTNLPPSGQEAARQIRAISGLLAHSDIALLVLHSFSEKFSDPFARQASVRLRFENQGWIKHINDVRGWQSNVTIQKSRLTPAGRVVNILIKLPRTAP